MHGRIPWALVLAGLPGGILAGLMPIFAYRDKRFYEASNRQGPYPDALAILHSFGKLESSSWQTTALAVVTASLMWIVILDATRHMGAGWRREPVRAHMVAAAGTLAVLVAYVAIDQYYQHSSWPFHQDVFIG